MTALWPYLVHSLGVLAGVAAPFSWDGSWRDMYMPQRHIYVSRGNMYMFNTDKYLYEKEICMPQRDIAMNMGDMCMSERDKYRSGGNIYCSQRSVHVHVWDRLVYVPDRHAHVAEKTSLTKNGRPPLLAALRLQLLAHCCVPHAYCFLLPAHCL